MYGQNNMSYDYGRNIKNFINDSQRPTPFIVMNQSNKGRIKYRQQQGINPLAGMSKGSIQSTNISNNKNGVIILKKNDNGKRNLKFDESPIKNTGVNPRTRNASTGANMDSIYGVKGYSIDRSLNIDQFKINKEEKKNSNNFNKMNKNFFDDKSNRSKSPDFIPHTVKEKKIRNDDISPSSFHIKEKNDFRIALKYLKFIIIYIR